MKPPDQTKRELVREWLVKAEEDLGAAKYLLSGATCFPSVVAFHAQPAAEKHLKALLTWQQIEFPKTHDIDELLDLLTAADANLAASLRVASSLTPYAVEVRYPSDIPSLAPDEARNAVELSGRVASAILAALAPALMADS